MFIQGALLLFLLAFQNCGDSAFIGAPLSSSSALESGGTSSADPNADNSTDGDTTNPSGSGDGEENPPPPAMACAAPPPVPAETPRPLPTLPVGGAGPFEWRVTEFGDCDKSCGDGLRHRQVSCFDLAQNRVVTDQSCASETRPNATEACFIDNPQCEMWVTSVSDYLSLSTRNPRFICLRNSIDFSDQVVTESFPRQLRNQTLNGCGHSLRRLQFNEESLFNTLNSAEILNLVIEDPLIQVRKIVPAGTSGFWFGGLAKFINGSSRLENVTIDIQRPGRIEVNGLATYCGFLSATLQAGTLQNVLVRGRDLVAKCQYMGGAVGYIHSTSGNLNLENVHVTVDRFTYEGSGWINNDRDAGGYWGGLTGMFQTSSASSQIRMEKVEVKSHFVLAGPAHVAGGIMGNFHHGIVAAPLFRELSFIGEIHSLNRYASGDHPAIAGLIANYHAHDPGKDVVRVVDSIFTGQIRLRECSPTPLSRGARTLRVSTGLVESSHNGNAITLENFARMGGIEVSIDNQARPILNTEQGTTQWTP